MSSVYFELLSQGKLIEAVYAVLLDRVGPAGFVMFFFAIFVMLWLRTQDMTIPTILAILTGGMILTLCPPEIHMVAYILVAFGVMSILYKVFKS